MTSEWTRSFFSIKTVWPRQQRARAILDGCGTNLEVARYLGIVLKLSLEAVVAGRAEHIRSFAKS